MKKLSSQQLRQLYRSFFTQKGHRWIESASLVPENDPTVLFTTAGMHPLVPYLIGQSHPAGRRLASVQKCIRTDDILEVGDAIHHTFFEMLGNWSLGDYFKEDAIKWSWEFLTSQEWLDIDSHLVAVSVFVGDEDAPFDQEAYNLWIKLGVSEARIAKLPKKSNWWGPAGQTGPCGPDTEIFYWTGQEEAPKVFDPGDARWVEIWNDVFMQYDQTIDGKYQPLIQKNVDTGMGLSRVVAVLNCLDDDYRTDLYWPIIKKIEDLAGKKYEDFVPDFRIIADHVVAAVFAIGDGVLPSNKGAGYIVRRLLRRVMVRAHTLKTTGNILDVISQPVFEIYSGTYTDLAAKKEAVSAELMKEEMKFRRTLITGLKELEHRSKTRINENNEDGKIAELDGEDLFNLFQTFGLPPEISIEEAGRLSIPVEEHALATFNIWLKQHQDQSRTASAGMFKGGLQDQSAITTKYHTATHLLLAALKEVLGDHVHQKGSNITEERLRFDFSHPSKMTDEQLKQVETLINKKINQNLPVTVAEMTVEEAKKSGAAGVFNDRYGHRVKVYSIGNSSAESEPPFSREICGGPHVSRTGEIGGIDIVKEESVSAGVRRIKARIR